MSASKEMSTDFDLISAISKRDASTEDIASQLREKGILSVNDVIDHIRQTAVRMSENLMPVTIDFRKFNVPLTYEPRRDAVHKIPDIPVTIDGTLYDPKDIMRFDGQELHFVPAPDREYMIAISDRTVISKWWEMTYLSSVMAKSAFDALSDIGGDSAIARSDIARSDATAGEISYYDDVGGGSWISHRGNRGYVNLKNVSMGIFSGNWNDKISSALGGGGMRMAILHEHVGWTGSTFTMYAYKTLSPEGPVQRPIIYERNLHTYGWGDRASSVEGW